MPAAHNGLLFQLPCTRLVLTLLFTLLIVHPAGASVTITVLDVGQGDATLVQSSSGRTLLFDGGENGRGNGVIVPFLIDHGITTLDYIVASHYHADHIGGLDEVYAAVGVNEAVYDRGWSYTTQTYNNYASTVSAHRQTLLDDQVIDLGDGVTARCIALNSNGVLSAPYDDSGSENEYDVALLIECGDFDFFQAGDLTGGGGSYDDIESTLAVETGEIEIYRVSHHGSYSSSNAYFLSVTQPEVAIISVGNNSYGHPHQDVLDRLQAYGAFVYQTESGSGGWLPSADCSVVGGHITITTDGSGEYTVQDDHWAMDEPATAVPDVPGTGLSIAGNFPNPFNPATAIRFSCGLSGPARLLIHDVRGRLVYRKDFSTTVGEQCLRWSGLDLMAQPVPAGGYHYTLETPAGNGTGTMMLVK